jgi:indolepyruvate ferredoxin oxidoreductase alpha subunit
VENPLEVTMSRFVVHVSAVLALAEREAEVAQTHELLAPTLVRSQVLSRLHEAVHAGDLDAGTARSRLTWIGKQPMRLLGDAVLRRRAWELADELGWPSTYDAEYVALTILQADALITLDAELERAVRGIVETAPLEAIL